MKKIISTLAILLTTIFALVSCKSNSLSIAIPNDPTNRARALMLLEANDIIELKEGVGIKATPRDITKNPLNIVFEEVLAPQIPRVIKSVDYAVINSNYALPAGLNPNEDSLAIEGSESPYGNVLAVKRGNENSPKIKALYAALTSQAVKDFITTKYNGTIISVVENPTDGFDSAVDYEALKGEKITVGASPVPHKEILEKAKEILATKGIKLEIVSFTDYIQPNIATNANQLDANYFQHLPYLEEFNISHNTDIVSLGAIHVEPLGVYSVKHDSLDLIKLPVEK